MKPFSANVEEEAKSNKNFRKVLFTGAKSQLVVMRLRPGEDIGLETHKDVEQTLFVVEGNGMALAGGKTDPMLTGDVLVVPPGTAHNVMNGKDGDMCLITVYAPPNHLPGTVHKTKADAEKDKADEKFEEEAPKVPKLPRK